MTGESMLDFLDIFILILLLVMIVGILIGKGQQVIGLLNGSRNNASQPKYDTKKQERVILIFCFAELGCLAIYRFAAPLWAPAVFIAIGITVVMMIWLTRALKKCEL